MTMEGHMEERAEQGNRFAVYAARDAAERLWMNQSAPPEMRLPAFDHWLRRELVARLEWDWAGTHKEKRMEQCRIQIDTMILALWRRGWMLDGKKLAARIIEMLDAIGTAQRKGGIKDFWSYFKASVSRYVGLNAEEIQAEAMSAGAATGAVFQQLLRRAPAKASIPELVAQRTQETLREKIARQKRQDGLNEASARQIPLL